VNLIADVALVVGLGWGIGGAALATVASQAVVATALVYLLLKTGREKRLAAETAGNGSSRVDDVKASYYEGGVILEDADAVIDEDAVELPSLEAVPRSIPGLAKAKRFTKIAGPGVVPKLDQGFVRGEFGAGGDGHLPGVLRGERCVFFFISVCAI
jgi:hypothetical protein